MGILRFILALLVMASHAGLAIAGLNPGVMAVVVFYVISGYVMSALIARHYAHSARTLHFYGDRLLRIYPQYAFYALAAALWLYTIGHPTPFLNPPASATDLWNNLLIVPLNYYMFNAADRFTLVPPAWSLGAELLFYLLVPWLWRHWRLAMLLGLGSLGVQVLAWHGQLQPDWWGYRLLPGVLWLFVLGMALHRCQSAAPRASWPLVTLAVVAALAAVVYLRWRGLLQQPYHLEVLLGLALGLPSIQLLSTRLTNSSKWQHLDATLGNWSYGIFLNHFLLLWTMGLAEPQGAWQWLALALTSIACSAFTQRYLEQPLLQLRRRWRTPVRPDRI